jgi:hypothetical protein
VEEGDEEDDGQDAPGDRVDSGATSKEQMDEQGEDFDVIPLPGPILSPGGGRTYSLRGTTPAGRRSKRTLSQTIRASCAPDIEDVATGDGPHVGQHTWNILGPEVCERQADERPKNTEPQKRRHRNEKVYEQVTVCTVCSTKQQLYREWLDSRTKEGKRTTLSYSSFCRVLRHRYDIPRMRTDVCDYCADFQRWDRSRDRDNPTSGDEAQLRAFVTHCQEHMEQRRRFNACLAELHDGECRITVDFSEKLRLPLTMVQKRSEERRVGKECERVGCWGGGGGGSF